MKKNIALIIILTLVISLFSGFTFESSAKNKSFKDVKNDHWFYKNVMSLTARGLISGYPSGDFKPNNTIKVSEFIKIVVSSIDDSVKGQMANEDEPWYMPYVNKAIELGLVENGEFDDYDRNITRGEMARIIVRELSNKGQVLSET